MYTRRLAIAAALFFSVPALAQAPTHSGAQPGPDDRSKQWLALIDDANYADGYKQMATTQTRTGADAAVAKLRADREPLGAMASRNLKDVRLSKNAAGMPNGQYAVVRYDSSFAHKGIAIETVTLVLTKGDWSVVAYHID